jgi:HEAT repeat protein
MVDLVRADIAPRIIDRSPAEIYRMRQLLKDSDPKVRSIAIYELGLMGESAKPAIPQLISLLKALIWFNAIAHFLPFKGGRAKAFTIDF